MTDAQLYLAVGLPSLVVALGMIGNGFLYNALSARMSALEARMNGLEARMQAFEASVNQRLDIIIGKIGELDTRLGILEDRYNR